jgi:hypothetical protein
MRSAEGAPWSALEAGVWAAVGAAAGAVAAASEAGALAAGAAGAGVVPEDCCAAQGSAADRAAQIKMEEVENFTMSPPMFDKKPSGRNAAGNSRAQFPPLYASHFVSRNAIVRRRPSLELSFHGALD